MGEVIVFTGSRGSKGRYPMVFGSRSLSWSYILSRGTPVPALVDRGYSPTRTMVSPVRTLYPPARTIVSLARAGGTSSQNRGTPPARTGMGEPPAKQDRGYSLLYQTRRVVQC